MISRVRSPSVFICGSEYNLQRQLHRPRPPNLIQRIEAAILPTAAERGSQHLGRLPEERRTHIVCRRAEVGVVEDVEKVRSHLKRKLFAEFELSAQRQIDLRRTESAQGISSQISLDRSRGCRECCPVDSLSAGYVRIGDPEWDSGNEIRPLYAGGSRQETTEGILSGDYIHRRRGSSVNDRISRPVSKDR